jgi:predicted metal-dependent hydrolase
VEAIAYDIRRSDRARRVRVTVDHAQGVVVVVPAWIFRRGRGAAEHEAAAAVTELRPWIERRLDEMARTQAALSARRGAVPYLGESLRLVPEPGRARVHRRGSELIVPAGNGGKPAIERWFRRAAHAEITPRLDRACAQAGSCYSKLTIRGQRTRWASCSRAGAMSFNWRLLMAPEPVLDYVVWHEVCHLDVMDHSPRFWALLQSRCPDYRQHVRWLKRYGATLVL